jgi:hypothetical protein
LRADAGDDRLPRQAIQTFNDSRISEGITRSRYPSSVRQIIPTFSLLWVGMVHDFWMYRSDPLAFQRGKHCHLATASMATENESTVVTYTHAERWISVVMGRAACQPTVASSPRFLAAKLTRNIFGRKTVRR